MKELLPLSWPPERLGEAVVALIQAANLSTRSLTPPVPPGELSDTALSQWLKSAVYSQGIDVQSAQVTFGELAIFLQTAGPAILRIEADEGARFLALLGSRGKKAFLLGPRHRQHTLPVATIQEALAAPLAAPILPQINQLIRETAVAPQQQARLRQLMLQEQLANTTLAGCWLLDLAPGSPFRRQLRRSGIVRQSIIFTITYMVKHFLFLFSWWVIGQAIFRGRVESAWLTAWVLILFTLVPLQLWSTWLQGVIAVNLGGLLQKRLLAGTMRLNPDEIRHEGAGMLMGRVFESEAIETISLNGGIRGLTALIELVMAGGVLALGAGGAGHALLLLAWLCIISAILYRFYQRRNEWTIRRRGLTHQLIELMGGHRTRLAQLSPRYWHRGEDEALASYVKVLDGVDRTGIALELFISRGWLLVGLLGLAPAFMAGSDPVALAISLGGILSAGAAFNKFALGLVNQLVAGVIAWGQISPLFNAADQALHEAMPLAVPESPTGAEALLNAHDLSFRYSDGSEPVLKQCSLQIQAGDRLLLEGPSGGGKSTLASLLNGLRQPGRGTLTWRGLPQKAFNGAGPHPIASAPQFHENHVFGNTFLFNLLIGSHWPPRPDDIEKAGRVCQQLGLQDLLERMPAGMMQMVGETGWQLSHGEKSRLYIARALLQDSQFLIFDESFAALDPESLQQTMHCVLNRAPAIMVIAHT